MGTRRWMGELEKWMGRSGQSKADVARRSKHSTAHVLHQLGLIESPEAHPDCKDLRGADEAQRMAEAMRRPKRLAQKLGVAYFGT